MEKREKEKSKEEKIKEIIKRYNIDIKKLEEEQRKLAKGLEIKDSIDFSLVERIAAIDNAYYENKIVSGVIVVAPTMEILEQEYFSDKLKFPYIPGFRAYRELPTMVEAVQKLEEKPDVVFIRAHGILHPRLGLTSHFSIVTGIPSIGVTDKLLIGEIKGEDIFIKGKKVGKVLQSKQGSKPLFISPGSLISLKTAYELSKKFIREPHKFPEPLHLAHKYVKRIGDELLRV